MRTMHIGSVLLLLACGGAAPSPGARAVTNVDAASPWVGSFGALSSGGAHSHLVAIQGEHGWSAELHSYALGVECVYRETPGTRSESTLGVRYACRSGEDDDDVVEGDTTITLLTSGHLTGDFGTGVLELAPEPPRPAPPPNQPIPIDGFVGHWYGTGIVADEELDATFRIENGALAGTATFSFSDRMQCRITEDPATREPGRVHVHVTCTCDYAPENDFERDCTFEQMTDIRGVVTDECYYDRIELTPAVDDGASAG